jgi:hypothetical protein
MMENVKNEARERVEVREDERDPALPSAPEALSPASGTAAC